MPEQQALTEFMGPHKFLFFAKLCRALIEDGITLDEIIEFLEESINYQETLQCENSGG